MDASAPPMCTPTAHVYMPQALDDWTALHLNGYESGTKCCLDPLFPPVAPNSKTRDRSPLPMGMIFNAGLLQNLWTLLGGYATIGPLVAVVEYHHGAAQCKPQALG